ncbi:MAG: OprD family outer membrane porin [Campylobacterota bacterium]|nr:OprD family outer membrane porin [Campylobacterota bacterium]
MPLLLLLVLLISSLFALEPNDASNRYNIPFFVTTFDDLSQDYIIKLQSEDSVKDMIVKAEFSGEIRGSYLGYFPQEKSTKYNYASAVGAQLKYATNQYYGISAAAAFYSSYALKFASGSVSDGTFNDELTSKKEKYNTLAELYANFSHNSLNIRLGRQILDTPLADSDDVRMFPNTFEAYIATYTVNNLTLFGGKIDRWQGYDSNYALESRGNWVQTGENNKGTYVGALTYDNEYSQSGIWGYNIADVANLLYIDTLHVIPINPEISFVMAAQFLHEIELSGSGIEADIYGLYGQLHVNNFDISLGYNSVHVDDNKEIFGGFVGFGGGAFYTNMDTMGADTLTNFGGGNSVVATLSYNILNNLNMQYIIGDFIGSKSSHVVEQDFIIAYDISENSNISVTYVVQNDINSALKSEYDTSHLQVVANYDF